MKPIFLLLLITAPSCVLHKDARTYVSLDESTGGFVKHETTLSANGKVNFLALCYTNVETNDSLSTWQSDSIAARGTWRNSSLGTYIEIEHEEKVRDFLIKNSVIPVSNRKTFIFSQKEDTLFVYGLPCTLIK